MRGTQSILSLLLPRGEIDPMMELRVFLESGLSSYPFSSPTSPHLQSPEARAWSDWSDWSDWRDCWSGHGRRIDIPL